MGFILGSLTCFKTHKVLMLKTEELYMESMDKIYNSLGGFTNAEKKKADAVAGGSFQKILVELQILRNSFGKKYSFTPSKNNDKTNRANDILDIFLLQQKAQKESARKIQTFEIGSPLDINELRRDISTPRAVPVFLEKRFELFGPTTITRFI